MPHPTLADPALTVALALLAGLAAQSIAWHLRIPGIVLLLAAGALLGPEALGVIRPESLGEALRALVGYAVAVILFEGGLNLNLRQIRRESGVIRRLITIGAVITALGGAAAAHLLLGWDWRLSLLFGTLVIVTGPTVIQPLVRRIRLRSDLQTVLEAEGVLIDPIGAIVAVVALELAVHADSPSVVSGARELVARLGGGALFGAAGGLLLAALLRPKRLIPEGYENVFVLGAVLALFHGSNAFFPESGIAAAVTAGMAVGNVRTRVLRDLMEFKEQLTLLLIGLLFVLLAADVRFAEVRSLGWAGLGVVAALMFVVRPLNVAASTFRSGLSGRQVLFLSFLAPRGIVAAAVASFFASVMDEAGMEGGAELRAMVFLVIAVTVLVQGLAGGPLASLLGVRRGARRGYAVLGANELGLALGAALRECGEETVYIDSNAGAVRAAQEGGFRAVFGNALEERTLHRAGLADRAGCVALTPNEEVNLLFATRAGEEFKVPKRIVALHLREGHLNEGMIREEGATILFGAQRDIHLWSLRLRRGKGIVEWWAPDGGTEETEESREAPENVILPLAVHAGGRGKPVDDETRLRKADRAAFVIAGDHRAEAEEWLRGGDWRPDGPPPGERTGS
ncbi:MAG: cation:proton antiporter [Candidatus Eisenbacteria bacterium]|nr:cation:proton antiporter [Candidatus Eisenbacteria bacterium]